VEPSIARAVERIVAAHPAGENRPGQLAMAEAVAHAIDTGEHLAVQAGTGTGKSLGYLIPAILSGKRTVVATATKALQEQLVDNDLPFLAAHLGRPFTAALLKGRSNYLCLARVQELTGDMQQRLEEIAPHADQLRTVLQWATDTPSGDRADLPAALTNQLWSSLSVSSVECVGKARCEFGDSCFAEAARDRAAVADVVVVNIHLYCVHLATGGAVLPDHDLVVIDEAHALEDIAADSFGIEIGRSRFDHLAAALRGLFTGDDNRAATITNMGQRVERGLEPRIGERVDRDPGEMPTMLTAAAEAVAGARGQASGLTIDGAADTKRKRLVQLADALLGDLRRAAAPRDDEVAWVERDPAPVLRLAPVDVGEVLANRLFPHRTVVLTSATLAVAGSFEPLARRLGLDRAPGDGDDNAKPPVWHGIDVGSPFDYASQALLYCAAHLPDPRDAGYIDAVVAELAELITAAGGRTLALFTSYRVLNEATARLRDMLPFRILTADDLPRPQLMRAFAGDEHSCLFATMGFWQGVDVPGPALSMVVIDRLPFPRPDDPLAAARRDTATRQRRDAFRTVDLPRAATLLAQGAGRLIRSTTDRGVVAVLDRRLATAGYKWDLVRSLPPMRRTRDPNEVRAFLTAIAKPSAT
jgi:ATP-dependent DNA helicase DinG